MPKHSIAVRGDLGVQDLGFRVRCFFLGFLSVGPLDSNPKPKR